MIKISNSHRRILDYSVRISNLSNKIKIASITIRLIPEAPSSSPKTPIKICSYKMASSTLTRYSNQHHQKSITF
jgi:hypothetical protein